MQLVNPSMLDNRRYVESEKKEWDRPTSGKHFSRFDGNQVSSILVNNINASKKIDRLMGKLAEYNADETQKEF